MSSYIDGYYGDCWLGYVAKLKREDIKPHTVLKVGITNAKDPMFRLRYKRNDEPYPISKYFPKIEILKVVKFQTEEEAIRWERRVMWEVKTRYKSKKFHDWREDDPVSGITEMRTWRDNEALFVLSIA